MSDAEFRERAWLLLNRIERGEGKDPLLGCASCGEDPFCRRYKLGTEGGMQELGMLLAEGPKT